MALQAVIWLGTTALIAIAAAGPALPARARHVLLFAGVSAAASIPAVPTYITLLTHAGTSAFNANGFDLTGVLQYLTNDGPVLWLTLAAFVPLAIALRVWERAWSDVGVLVGLAVASIGLMLLTDELRTAYLTQPLAIASTAIVFSRLLDKALRLERAQEPVGRPLRQPEPVRQVGDPQAALAAGKRAQDRRRSFDGLDSHGYVPLLPNPVRQCRIDRCMDGDER